jgi:hypothetical protein
LKNFSTINKNLEFKKGNKISTISETKTVLAQAELNDNFPDDFCVYDLNEFLSVASLYKDDLEINFDTSNVIFTNGTGKRKTQFRKTAKSNVVTPPDKQVVLSNPEIKFTLTADNYGEIMKSSSVLSSPNIAVESDGEKVFLVAFDAKDDSQHTDKIELNVNASGNIYSVVFKKENLKMVPGDYDVEISFKGISHFKNTKESIEYWIAIEAKESKFTKE